MDAVPAEPSAAQEIAAVRVPRGLTPRLHSGISVSRFFGLHAMGALFPIAAGAMLYGWRAIVSMAVVVISAAAGIAVWKRIGIRGYQLRYAHGLWLALLLALMLPAHLATKLPLSDQTGRVLWPILPAAGICIATLLWLLGGLGSARIHPVLVAYLVVSVFFQKDLVPHWILQRQHVFAGDVLDVSPAESAGPRRDAWIKAKPPSEPVLDSNHPRAALRSEPASQQLIFFTSGTEPPARAWLSLEGLMRDVMPPLEDCIIGGQPGPIGTSSVIAVIIGGLFLLYRGLIDYRIPLFIYLSAALAFFLLPIPVVIRETGPQWRWLALRMPGVGWAMGTTFVNYEILAGPLLFTAFFLATAPAVRPMAQRARSLYAISIGVLAAVFQLYASVSFGPYVALLLVSLLTPTLDKWFAPKPLV